jgi:hypothetical protein
MKTVFIREIPLENLTLEQRKALDDNGFTMVYGAETVCVYANVEPFELPAIEQAAA